MPFWLKLSLVLRPVTVATIESVQTWLPSAMHRVPQGLTGGSWCDRTPTRAHKACKDNFKAMDDNDVYVKKINGKSLLELVVDDL
jgi:hypothetical protein